MNLTFKPLTPKDYVSILPFFPLRPTLTCESHFLYHVIWKDFYNSKYCLLDDGILWLQNIGNKVAALPPITKKDNLKEYFELLQNHFTDTLQKKLNLYLVDEEALEALELDQAKYKIVEDRDSFDYIYDANKLKTLSGRKYHKKKNHLNFFIKNYGDHYEYKSLTERNKKEILDFSHTWAENKDSKDPHNRIESEEIGLQNILESFPISDFKMAGIYIHDNLEAISVGTYDKVHKTAVIHIEKANPHFRGLYPFINQQFLIHEFPDALYVNREDDMGLIPLRKAKESYNPIFMAKKYTIIEL